MLATDRAHFPIMLILALVLIVIGVGGGFATGVLNVSIGGTFLAQDTDLNFTDGTFVGASGTFDGNIISITTDLLTLGGAPADGECLAWEATGSRLDFIACASGGGGGGSGVSMENGGVSLTGTTTIDFDQGILAIDVGGSVVRVRLQFVGATLTTDRILVGSSSVAAEVALSAVNVGTATALAANGGNCSPGNAPLGVDASGAVEGCFAVTNPTSTTDIFLSVRNTSGSTMDHGDLVYITGFHTGSGNPTISLADANGAGTFPVIGFVFELTINNNANGDVIVQGRIDSDIAALNTSACSADDEVYLSTTPGVFTCTRPTGANDVIDELGIVLRSHATLGEIEIIGSGHAVDLPNLASGSLWWGNLTNMPIASAASDVVGSLNALTATNLASNPTDCGANTFAVSIVASGNLTCTSVDISDDTNLAAGRSVTLTGDSIAADVELYARNCSITYSLASDTLDAGLNANANCAPQDALPMTITDIECITSTGSASVTFDERTRAGINSAGTLIEPIVNCTTTLKSWPSISAIDNAGIAAAASIEIIPGTVTADMVLHIWIGVTIDD